jgi:hypothetical protein
MKVRCECGKEYEIHEQLIGKTVRCQQCSRSFVVPRSPSPSQPTIVQAAATIVPSGAAASGLPSSGASRAPRAAAPVAATQNSPEAKDRSEREQQLIAQYVQYKPKPGSRLRGAVLAKAMARGERRERLGGALRLVGLGIGLAFAAVFGFFKLRQMEVGDERTGEVHWIMSFLNMIGGKWTAAVGLGVIALGCLVYAFLYWRGFFVRRKR